MTNEEIIDFLQKTYQEIINSEGGNSYCIINGKWYETDMGYALEGMEIFIDVIKRKLNI